MPKTTCLGGCGRLIDKRAARKTGRRKRAWGRCDRCAAGRSYINSAETARRKAAVAAWVFEHGYLCPGWRCPPHRSTDLTADHVVAVAAGGDEHGRLQVLCRSCNSAKAAG